MHICFYIHPFRDRDFWPIARTALGEGHTIFYALAERTSPEEILAQDKVMPFDLVISADRVSFIGPDRWLHLGLQNEPTLLEIIFNGLIEIVEGHAAPGGDFGHLAARGIFLGIMDPDLLKICASIGINRVIHVPYGVPGFRFAQPDFFIRRLARRALGNLTPVDLQNEAGKPRYVRRIMLKVGLKSTRRKSTEIVFLGECNLAKNPSLLESIRARFFPDQQLDRLLSLDDRVRAGFEANPSPFCDQMSEAVAEALAEMGDRADTLIGKALLTEHFLHQYRTARRLRYVRHLKEKLGSRFALYGDDFRRLGIDALPSSHGVTENKYLDAKIAIDFGSNSYGVTLYTRSVRVIYCDALLLQLRQDDAAQILGQSAADVTFTSPDEMVARASGFLDSPQRLENSRKALQALGMSKAGMAYSLKGAFDTLALAEARR